MARYPAEPLTIQCLRCGAPWWSAGRETYPLCRCLAGARTDYSTRKPAGMPQAFWFRELWCAFERFRWEHTGVYAQYRHTCFDCGKEFSREDGHCCDLPRPRVDPVQLRNAMLSDKWLRDDIDWEAEQTGWKYYD